MNSPYASNDETSTQIKASNTLFHLSLHGKCLGLLKVFSNWLEIRWWRLLGNTKQWSSTMKYKHRPVKMHSSPEWEMRRQQGNERQKDGRQNGRGDRHQKTVWHQTSSVAWTFLIQEVKRDINLPSKLSCCCCWPFIPSFHLPLRTLENNTDGICYREIWWRKIKQKQWQQSSDSPTIWEIERDCSKNKIIAK